MNSLNSSIVVTDSQSRSSVSVSSPSTTKAPRRKMSRPALRLISTNGLSHDSWLNVRRHGIGSSDAAAAVGLNTVSANPTVSSQRGCKLSLKQKLESKVDAA